MVLEGDIQAGMLMARRRLPCDDLGERYSGQRKSKCKGPEAGFSGKLVWLGLGGKGQGTVSQGQRWTNERPYWTREEFAFYGKLREDSLILSRD